MTRSVEWTVENILDGILTMPHHLIEEPQAEFVPQTQPSMIDTVSIPLNQNSDPRFDIPFADR